MRSFFHIISNRAGGLAGRAFQAYLLLWILWSAYYVTGNLGILVQTNELQQTLTGLAINILLPYLPAYTFWLYEKKNGIVKREKELNSAYESINAEHFFPIPLELGIDNPVSLQVNNPTDHVVRNVWIRVNLPGNIICSTPQMKLGDIDPGSSARIGIPFIPLSTDRTEFGTFDIYFELQNRKYMKEQIALGKHEVSCSFLHIDAGPDAPFKFGLKLPFTITLENRFPYPLTNLQMTCSFAKGIGSDDNRFNVDQLQSGATGKLNTHIIPESTRINSMGHFTLSFLASGNLCRIGPIEFEKSELIVPELDIRLNMPDAFYKDVPASIGIVAENRSDVRLSNVCFSSCFPSFLDCQTPMVCVNSMDPGESRYTSIKIKTNVSGKIAFGNLNISFEVNGISCNKEPIDLGTHNVI